jgi:hypothetical protein
MKDNPTPPASGDQSKTTESKDTKG